jgi:hypothetical protein
MPGFLCEDGVIRIHGKDRINDHAFRIFIGLCDQINRPLFFHRVRLIEATAKKCGGLFNSGKSCFPDIFQIDLICHICISLCRQLVNHT